MKAWEAIGNQSAALRNSGQPIIRLWCRNIFLVLLLISSFSIKAQAPKPAPTPAAACPEVTVTCPEDTVYVGDTLTFTAQIKNPISGAIPHYSWTVNPRALTPDNTTGQSITIDTSSAANGDSIQATVTVSDLGNPCPPQTKPSCPVTVKARQALNLNKFAEIYAKSIDAEKKRILAETAQLMKDRPEIIAHLVAHDKQENIISMRSIDRRRGVPLLARLNYGAGFTADILRPDFGINEAGSRTSIITAQDQSSTPQTGDSPALRLAKEAKGYLETAGIDASRIIIDTGSPRYQTTVEIYLGPKGAVLPSTSMNATSPSVREEEIDVLWDVLPQAIAGDNFGKRVRKKFYVIQVAIANNSGVEFQLLSFGFTLGSAISGVPPRSVIPPTDYRLVRGTILQEQQNGIRNLSLSLIKGGGLLLTGFVPFFKVDRHRANFSQLLNIFSNPLEIGFELFFPDRTIENLSRLDNVAWRDGLGSTLSIPNNTQVKTFIFFPKDMLTLNKADRDNPQIVRRSLANLVVIGSATQYIKRVIKTQP
jgi:hypothetical protein